MVVVVRQCEREELSIVIEQLDREFVSRKDRSLSLAKRFPNTLSVENVEQVRLAISEEGLCGVHAVRLFEWLVDGQIWQGAMIGMVWVDPSLRGQGLGGLIMASATEFLREKRVDFGVLWTGAEAFYERAGWFRGDRGLLGEASKVVMPPCSETVLCQPLSCEDPGWLESVRSRFETQRVARTPVDYHAVPIPALHVLCFSIHADDEEGFALVGEQDGKGYFYEIAAPTVLWNGLWTAITDSFDRIVVNGWLDDPFSDWLAEQAYVVWQPRNKAMWLHVSDRSKELSLPDWNIPYFDWI